MKKIFIILFTLSLLINLSKSIDNLNEEGSYSQLIKMIRKEIVEKSLLYLPKKNNVNLLEMLLQIVKAKDEYLLNEAESAYLAYQWIIQNIKYDYNAESEDLGKIYDSGKGNMQGISSLFNRICQYLKIESDSISGYIKERGAEDFVASWNYVVVEESYYLVDATMGGKVYQDQELHGYYYTDLFFGTYPEIFIRYNFPKESKWQLLSEPITKEQFDGMAYIQRAFHLFGFKTISPDTSEINESGTIVLTYDESITDITIQSWFFDSNMQKIEQIECKYGNGKVEVKYNLNNEKAAYLYFLVNRKTKYYTTSFAYYIINKSSK